MSHFYGGVKGGKGEATRCGFKSTGIHAYIKTWDTLVRINLTHDEQEDRNYYHILGVCFPEEDLHEMSKILQAGANHYYEMKREFERELDRELDT